MSNSDPERPELRPGEVPPERWSIERVFDSSEYLDGEPPLYPGDPGYTGGPNPGPPRALYCQDCGHEWRAAGSDREDRYGRRWIAYNPDDAICSVCGLPGNLGPAHDHDR